jgi:hypothetical protein
MNGAIQLTAENTRDFGMSEASRTWTVGAGAERMFSRLLTAAIVLLFGFQAHLSIVMAINWDEFHPRGELGQAVNTLHVHLFKWLRLIPGGEINQLVAARLLMLCLEAGTVLAIVRIAERFVPRWAALAGALVYLSNSYVLLYGPSFRTDPISTFLLMSALGLLVCSELRRGHAVAIGVLVALAGLVTIKAAIYLPSLAVVAWWRWRAASDRKQVFRRFLLAATVGLAVFASLFYLHSIGLTLATSSASTTSSAYRKMLHTGMLFPKWPQLQHNLAANISQWLVMLVGVASAAVGALRAGRDRMRWIAVSALALPMSTLAFYTNAYPYYYGFMLAPAGVVAAIAFATRLKAPRIAGALLFAMVVSAAISYWHYVRHDQGVQRAVVGAVHRMFPAPVPYVEKADMIASFPEVGVHMTEWGMANYRDAGRPVFSSAEPGRRPVFVIVGNVVLERALKGENARNPVGFLPQDAAFLSENFIPHWGPIWVAGKRFRLDGADARFEIEIPKTYTLDAQEAVRIDGALVRPGQSVELAVGAHSINGRGEAVLRWGDNLHRPSEPVPAGRIYWPF